MHISAFLEASILASFQFHGIAYTNIKKTCGEKSARIASFQNPSADGGLSWEYNICTASRAW